MSDRPTPVIVYLSGHARGRTHRLSGDRLVIGTGAAADIKVMAHELPPGEVAPGTDLVLGTLDHRDGRYELAVAERAEVWVNGKPVDRAALASGDVIEIGAGGPVLRFRLYEPGSAAYKSMAEAFSDCRDCARHGGRGVIDRARILLAGTPLELATQTSPLVRLSLAMIVVLLAVVGALVVRNVRLERRLAAETARVEGLSELLEQAESDTFSAADFDAARGALEGRITETLARVEKLESLAGSRERVIAEASRSVVFLQGSYGFTDRETGKPLRFIDPASIPEGAPRPDSPFTLEGDGPVLEVYYTGTGFIATDEGHIFTNRHVALPWEAHEQAKIVVQQGYDPGLRRFVGYLPGVVEPFEVSLVGTSDTADVALLRSPGIAGSVPPVPLSSRAPRVGEEVVVIGYPTGMQALVARADPAFIRKLLDSGPLDFWSMARGLSEGGHISPLATVGIVGHVGATSIVYDAETTFGGSGGPVLDLEGQVVAVNSAILPEFGGSNLGVPAGEAGRLLEMRAKR